MAKKVVSIDEGIAWQSMKSMILILAKLLGDEVYIRPVFEVESSEQVIKSLDAVLEGMKKNVKKAAA